LCFIGACREGPFTRLQLRDHLATEHIHDYSIQPHFGDYIAAMPFLGARGNDLGTRHLYTLFHVVERRREGKDACPVRNVGCDFRLSFDEPIMECHIEVHDLGDRIACDEYIQSTCHAYRYSRGRATCPICTKTVWTTSDFLEHLRSDHSKEERLESASEFCRALASVPSFRRTYTFNTIIEEMGF
jgi:hypothetical protein